MTSHASRILSVMNVSFYFNRISVVSYCHAAVAATLVRRLVGAVVASVFHLIIKTADGDNAQIG